MYTRVPGPAANAAVSAAWRRSGAVGLTASCHGLTAVEAAVAAYLKSAVILGTSFDRRLRIEDRDRDLTQSLTLTLGSAWRPRPGRAGLPSELLCACLLNWIPNPCFLTASRDPQVSALRASR